MSILCSVHSINYKTQLINELGVGIRALQTF